MPACWFGIGDRQRKKMWWNSDRRATCDAMRGIDARCGVIHHWGMSDVWDGARPFWQSRSDQTEIFIADEMQPRRSIMWGSPPLPTMWANCSPEYVPSRRGTSIHSLPGHGRQLKWWLTKYFAEYVDISHFYRDMGNDECPEMQHQFQHPRHSLVLESTPKLRGIGPNL